MGGFVAQIDGDKVVAHVRGKLTDISRRPDPQLAVSVYAKALRRRVNIRYIQEFRASRRMKGGGIK